MRVPPREINGLLSFYFTHQQPEYLILNNVKEQDYILISLWDFIKSQMNTKIINTSYQHLLTSAVTLKNLNNNINEPSPKIKNNLSTIYIEYIRIISVCAMYLNLYASVKLYPDLPDFLLNRILSQDSSDSIIDLISISDTITDLEAVKQVLRDESLTLVDYAEVDYKFLTYHLNLYNQAKQGICAYTDWREFI